MGMEFRPYYLAKEWNKAGHEVTILAGDYSHLRKKNPSVERDFTEERIDGIRYVWVKTGEYSSNGAARALSMFRFCRKLAFAKRRIVKQYRPDVVISSSTYPLDTYPATAIARMAGARYIHEVHDMWPSTLYEAGGMAKGHPFVRLMQRAEDHAYRKADEVVSLMEHAEAYMKEHGLREGRFHHVPNGVLLTEWNTEAALPDVHREAFEALRAQGKFVLGYFGSHELSYGLHNLIEVVGELKEEDIALVMVGKGKLKEELIAFAKKRGVDNVVFLPPVEKTMVSAVVSRFDAIFIGTIASPLYRFGICMNKMYDSMMAAKPIVMAITTPPTPVSKAGCGIITDSCDNDAIKAAIRKIKAMTPEERVEMGERGRQAILEKYTYEKIAKQFEKVFRQ